MSSEICPYAEICLIYKNYVQQTNDERLNIISKNDERYECLAKVALEDYCQDGGIPSNKTIKGRLDNLKSSCSHITILNFLEILNE